MIYSAFSKKYKVPGVYDPDESRTQGLIFRPSVWQATTVYYKRFEDDFDIVLPTVFTGLYYKVKHPGKTGDTEPTWVKEVGQETIDVNGLIWEAGAFNFFPPGTDVISCEYLTTDDVVISDTSNTASSCTFTIDGPLPQAAIDLGSFEVTVRATPNLGGAPKDFTLVYKIGSR